MKEGKFLTMKVTIFFINSTFLKSLKKRRTRMDLNLSDWKEDPMYNNKISATEINTIIASMTL